MKEEKQEIEIKQEIVTESEAVSQRTQFFLDELARMDLDSERRYKHLSSRIASLEQKGKSISDDPEKLLGSLFLIIAVIQAIPLVIDLVRKLWASESLPSQS